MHLQRLKVLRPTVKEQMHLQDDFDLGFRVIRDVAQYPLHIVTYASAKFEVAMPNGLGDAFIRKYSIWSRSHQVLPSVTYTHAKFEVATSNGLGSIYKKIHYLTFGVKVKQNVVQFPLHHVTYAAAKFKVVMSDGLGGDAFTKKCII